MDMQVGCQGTPLLYMSIELSGKTWGLAFSIGEKVRHTNVRAGDKFELLQQVTRTKERFGLAADVRVVSCYEAGRDGFWIHRWLQREGIENIVIDPASIEINRRKRRIKTDRLDAEKMVLMLIRYYLLGERALWRVVRVPPEEAEDARRPHRELQRLVRERSAHVTRIKALLATQGIVVGNVLRMKPGDLRDWQGLPLKQHLLAELQREHDRLSCIVRQSADLEKAQAERLRKPVTPEERKAAKLCGVRGVGSVTTWTLTREFFGWREFKNGREIGALAGLVGTPYSSGESIRDRGISKAGNPQVRVIAIELAWNWLRFQPQSALSQWFVRRFADGGSRMRRIGIVALARKVLIALWRYLEYDEIPAGAILKA